MGISTKCVNSMSDDIVFLKSHSCSTGAKRERFLHFNEACVFLCAMNIVGGRVEGWCVFARQGLSASDLMISMMCVNAMSDDIAVC